jgi:hypothetical protein
MRFIVIRGGQLDESQGRISMMVVRMTKTFPVRVMEWLLAGIMFSWSIVCWKLTEADWAQPMYSGLARFAENETWAFFAFWIGAWRLAALTINGAWRPSPHLRAIGAFLSCFMWLQISLGMMLADARVTGIAVFPWLLLADIYNVFRASHDARVSDDRARQARRAGVNESADSAAA